MAGIVVLVNPLAIPPRKKFPNPAVWSAYLWLGCVTLALYWRAAYFPFVSFDDYMYIVDNDALNLDFFPDGVAWSFTTFRGGNWHPLTWLSHMLDFKLFGLDAGGHHAVNITLHTASSLLLLRVLANLTGAFWRSALVASLFALHPLHVESVAWVSERKDTLGAFFFILALAAYLRYVQRRSTDSYLLVILCATLGLLSKPTVVTLPLVLLLLDFWPLGRLRPGPGGEAIFAVVREKIPLFTLAALTALLTLYSPAKLQLLVPLNVVPLQERIGNGFISYVMYLQMTVWPAGLNVLYPYPEALHWGRALLSAGVLATLSALAVVTIRARPAVAMGWLWYLATLFPMIGLVQVGSQVVADRYTYIPLVGIFVAVAWGLPLPKGGQPIRSALWILAVVLALGGCFIVSCRQVGTWRDSHSLLQRAIDVNGHNYLARLHLGSTLANERRFAEAIDQLRQTLDISPNYSLAHSALGITMIKMERFEEAVAHFREAVRLTPESAAAHFDLGRALILTNQPREGLGRLREAVRIDPGHEEAHLEIAAALLTSGQLEAAGNYFLKLVDMYPYSGKTQFGMGLFLAKAGRSQEAIAHFSRAAQVMPNSGAAHYNLAFALDRSGNTEQALEHYRLAIAIDAGNAEAHNNLGSILADRGQSDEAVGHFRQSTRLDPQFAEAHYNLGLALARLGDVSGAVSSLQTVLTMQPDHAPARNLLREIVGIRKPPDQ